MRARKHKADNAQEPGAAEVLRPAVRIDANYLRAMAGRVRTAVSEVLMPPLLEELEKEAQKGRLLAGIWLRDMSAGLDLDALSLGEAMVVALSALGFHARVVEEQRGRHGMSSTELMLQITWREVAG